MIDAIKENITQIAAIIFIVVWLAGIIGAWVDILKK
jgi:hypothetical protein